MPLADQAKHILRAAPGEGEPAAAVTIVVNDGKVRKGAVELEADGIPARAKAHLVSQHGRPPGGRADGGATFSDGVGQVFLGFQVPIPPPGRFRPRGSRSCGERCNWEILPRRRW